MLVSDSSVGKFDGQVGKKRSQIGKFDVQVGKIALQVGIAIFWLLYRRCHQQKRLLAAAKSSNLILPRDVLKRKVFEWPRPLSLGGYFDGIFGER